MSLIKNIGIGMSADTRQFVREINASAESLDILAESSERAKAATSRLDAIRLDFAPSVARMAAPVASAGSPGSSPRGEPSDPSGSPPVAQAALVAGAQLRSGLASSLAPLNQIGAMLTRQFDVVGGTIVTLARRVDIALKLMASESLINLKKISAERAKIEAPRPKSNVDFGMGSLKSAGDSVKRLDQTTLDTPVRGMARLVAGARQLVSAQSDRLRSNLASEADSRATGGFRLRIRSSDINFGSGPDVAKKSLTQLSRINFGVPIAGAKNLGGAVSSVAPAAVQAATAIRHVGTQVAIAFGAGAIIFKMALAVKDFFAGGIRGAINMQETMSKVKEVFGSSMGAITGQANDLAKSFGLPRQAILDASSALALLGQGAGQSKKQSADMATTLTQLAADASSFYNVPLPVALEKIRAGLSGEAEPLRSFGLMMSDTATKAEAVRMGLIRSNQEMNDQAKVAARTSLIVSGLSTASGDLARTGGGTQNQIRSLTGTIGNLATDIGTTLIPAVDAGVAILTGIATAAASSFEAVKPSLASFAAGVSEAFKAVGVVYRQFDSISQIVFLKAQEMGLNFIAILATIPDNLSIIVGYLRENWYKLLTDLVNATRSLAENIGTNLVGLFTAVQDAIAGNGFNFEWTPLLDGFKATADKLPELIKPAFVSMDAQIAEVGQHMADLEAARINRPSTWDMGAFDTPSLDLGGGAMKDDKDKYHGTAAVSLGSSEAGSSIARFRNQTADNAPAKQTAKSTERTAVAAEKTAISLDRLLNIASDPTSAAGAIFTI